MRRAEFRNRDYDRIRAAGAYSRSIRVAYYDKMWDRILNRCENPRRALRRAVEAGVPEVDGERGHMGEEGRD